MERLTVPAKKLEDGRTVVPIIDGRAVREHAMDLYWRLKEYEDMEEQGLLLKLPCKIGDDVYFIPSKVNYKLNILNGYEEYNRVYHQKVVNITFTTTGCYITCDKDMDFGTANILVDIFFKETWFLSEAEAEKALAEMEKEKV